MRTYQINVSGKDYTVEIDDLGASPVNVLVDGKAFEVTISEQGTVARSIASAGDEPEADVPTVAPTFVEAPTASVGEPSAAASSGGGARQVTAPMPGKVLDIAVQVGTVVQQGQTLCNLEAMKMKSPIRSTMAGTVVQITISEGQNVDFGDVLFTLE